MRHSFRKWLALTLGIGLGLCVLCALFVAVVDPYFHYHKPLEGLEYRIWRERYQNDGILRHFDYDTVILGSSMCQNFAASEAEELFGGQAVKVTISGSTIHEQSEMLSRAFAYHGGISTVIWGLDYVRLGNDPEEMAYEDSSFPDYLYDTNPFNDIEYLLNRTVLTDAIKQVLLYTLQGNKTTSFDDYGAWWRDFPFGRERIYTTYHRKETIAPMQEYTPELEETARQNTLQNILSLAQAHPETEFYLFITPNSIVFWDEVNRSGEMDIFQGAEKTMVRLLTGQENIHFYSFFLNRELIENLDNYKDPSHYSEKVCSWILQWLRQGEGLLTPDNQEDYFRELAEYTHTYDYDSI